jgi:hypothetical protein
MPRRAAIPVRNAPDAPLPPNQAVRDEHCIYESKYAFAHSDYNQAYS